MLHAKIVFGAAGPNSGPAVLPNAPCENHASDHKHEFPICGSTERSTQNPCFGFQTRTLDLHFYRTLHAKTVVLDLELDFSTLLGSRFFDTLYAKTQFRPRFTVWVFKILNSVNSTVGGGRGRARPGHFCGLGCHAGEHCTGAPAPNGKKTFALRGRGHGGALGFWEVGGIAMRWTGLDGNEGCRWAR